MKCPSCDQQPVSLLKWGSTTACFRTRCQHCDTNLGANWVTWVGFLLTVAVCIVIVALYREQFEELKQSFGRTGAYLLGIGIPAAVGGILTWLVGGYNRQN